MPKSTIRTVMLSSPDRKIIELWLARQASPHTRACYRRDADCVIEELRKPLKQIGLADLQRFANTLADSGLAPISQLRTIAAVRSLFGFCRRVGYLPQNPAAELPLPAYENRLAERILPETDVQRLLAIDGNARDRILLNLIYVAGLRVSEACQLRWRNLHPRGEAGQITVYGKGGRTRAITLPASVWSELTGLRGTAGTDEPVFPSRSGRTLDRGRVRRIVRRAPSKWVFRVLSAHTGYVTPMPAMRWTTARPFTWSRPPWGIVPWLQPARISMLGRAIPARAFCRRGNGVHCPCLHWEAER